LKQIQHKHVIIRAEILSPPEESEESEKKLNDSVESLIKAIGMKTVLPARCVWVGEKGNEGYTGQAGLETSHIAYHIWNKPDKDIMNCHVAGLLQLDVYTCGCLGAVEIDIIENWIALLFDAVKIEIMLLDRSKSLKRV